MIFLIIFSHLFDFPGSGQLKIILCGTKKCWIFNEFEDFICGANDKKFQIIPNWNLLISIHEIVRAILFKASLGLCKCYIPSVPTKLSHFSTLLGLREC